MKSNAAMKIFRFVLPCIIVLGLAFVLFRSYSSCRVAGHASSDSELITIAIKENLSLHFPGSERTKRYASPEDVVAQNPGCCSILNYNQIGSTYPTFFHDETKTVKIVYTINADTGEKYESYAEMTPCGSIKRSYGTLLSR